ncbi:MAG: NYN domain-containing protein [Gammaproteobacteria bacterium]
MNLEVAQTRVALLIDADNISPVHAGDLLKYAATHGNVVVRKGYGALGGGFPWKKEVVFKYAIEPVARYAYTSGKNVSDIALVIDAMDLMMHKSVEVVCIASNDSDFSLLAMKLRENGIKVYGFGEAKTLAAFVASCDNFVYLSSEENSGESAAAGEAEIDIKQILADACDNYGDDNGWANLSAIGGYLVRVNPAFSAKNYGGYKKLGDLVRNLGGFEVEHDADKLSTKIRKMSK